jgi:flagellar protein FliO/FliZ
MDSMAMLGKTAFALLFIIALLLILGYLIRRLNTHRATDTLLMRHVASTSLGPKERVVVLEINDTWLVLGVAGGRINKLHETPARHHGCSEGAPSPGEFAKRLSAALDGSRGADSSQAGSGV